MSTTDKPKRPNGAGSIGKWDPKRKCYPIAVVVPGTTRRLTARAKSQREAAAKLAALQRKADEQATPAALRRGSTETWTLSAWLDYWERVTFAGRKGRFKTGLSKSYKRRTAWALDALRDELGDTLLPNLRTEHVEDMLAKRAAGIGCKRKAWGQDSCSNVRNVLADALDEAIRREDKGIYRNVARRAGGFADAAAPQARHAISAEQADKLYRAARDSDSAAAPVVALLVLTGMRQHEARELRWGAVDLDAGTLEVVKAKTPLGLRTIDLAPQAIDVLRAQRAALGRVAAHPEAYVFPGAVADHVSAYAVIDELVRLCDRLSLYVGGDDEDDELRALKPHELRHTVASLLLQANVPSRHVAAMLGDKVETIERVYAKWLDDTVGTAAIAPLVSIFGQAS
jgi:integrase